jgi:hypothetical protein
MYLATVAPAVPFLGAATPVFADFISPGLQFVVFTLPLVLAGLAITLAVVLGGLWLARRGRKPGEGE